MTTSARRRWSGRERMVAIAAVVAALLVATTVAAASGTARADTAARYPADQAIGVPSSTAVIAHLDIGGLGRPGTFRIEVTDPDGRRVAGRSRTDESMTVSFTPDAPLRFGPHSVRLLRDADGADPTIIDSWSFTSKGRITMTDGHGGSILLVAGAGTTDQYLAEVLRAEGISGFDTVAPGDVTRSMLDEYTVAVVGAHASTPSLSSSLQAWVDAGGDALLIRPSGALAGVAGLRPQIPDLRDGYYTLDSATETFTGFPEGPLQFKGTAHAFRAADDVTTLAGLSARRDEPWELPAVTVRETAGGTVAAIAFDVADSVVRLRQGNPDWAGQDRDGRAPVRPNDLFTGGRGVTDYLDLENIGIPQADESMRVMTAVLQRLHVETAPLPRFWYLPNGEDAALVMTADDHGTTDGTLDSMRHMLATDEPGCDPKLWECARSTSWLYASSSLTNAQAAELSAAGFDFGVHASTDCEDWEPGELDEVFERSVIEFREKFPSLRDQRGHRMHCIAFSDWLTMPETARKWGMRFDMNYYNWPSEWLGGRSGYMTGSALPLRFADTDGRMINVFQQETHLVNESWREAEHEAAITALIEAARDDRGFVGAFGTHYDFSDPFDRVLVDVARRHDVPMVSAQQMLDFTDGRYASQFVRPVYRDGHLRFGLRADARSEGLLEAMLPVRASGRELVRVTRDGTDVAIEKRTIRGVEYAFFAAETSAGYEAVYEVSEA